MVVVDGLVAAAEAAERALAHPLLRQAEAASRQEASLLRESPVVLKREDGSLVEGVMDILLYV